MIQLIDVRGLVIVGIKLLTTIFAYTVRLSFWANELNYAQMSLSLPRTREWRVRRGIYPLACVTQ
jgi:hypothetical protein